MDVAPACLVEVVAPSRRSIGNSGGHRGVDTQRKIGGTGSATDDDARSTSAHEVQRSGVVGDSARNDGHVE